MKQAALFLRNKKRINDGRILQQVLGMMLAGLLLVGCSSAPGAVSGVVLYESLNNGSNAKPMPDVLAVLCLVPSKGLPEGPAVASSNRSDEEDPEVICTLQGKLTAISDEDGEFTLEEVPTGTYLVLFQLFPDELEGVDWDGIDVVEAPLYELDFEIPALGRKGFWQDGGIAIAIANWSLTEGMIVTKGNICSNSLGLCFSIQDELVAPVIEVESEETVKVKLFAHFVPEE